MTNEGKESVQTVGKPNTILSWQSKPIYKAKELSLAFCFFCLPSESAQVISSAFPIADDSIYISIKVGRELEVRVAKIVQKVVIQCY